MQLLKEAALQADPLSDSITKETRPAEYNTETSQQLRMNQIPWNVAT